MTSTSGRAEEERQPRTYSWAPEGRLGGQDTWVLEWVFEVQGSALSANSGAEVLEKWGDLHALHTPVRHLRKAREQLKKAEKRQQGLLKVWLSLGFMPPV